MRSRVILSSAIMGNNEDIGESSQATSNRSNDDERPLKKARYLWEVKGKYHLKASSYPNPANVAETHQQQVSVEAAQDENEQNNNNAALNNNNNNNNESCANRCCIESLLAKTDMVLDADDDDAFSKSDDTPISLVSPTPKTQKYYMHKWQARQMARGFMDNTINIVLENWMGSPFDATDLVDSCDNGGQVEDEGIMMAIQSHGLQSNLDDDGVITYEHDIDCGQDRKQSAVSFVRPQEMIRCTFDNFENVHNELINAVSSSSASSNCHDSMSCDSISNQTMDGDGGLDMSNPVDFMNAAVSVAIQKKGLSSYGY